MRRSTGNWVGGAACLAATLLIAGCSSLLPPGQETASIAAPVTDPVFNQQISHDALWLGTHKLPVRPDKLIAPKAAVTCPEKSIKDQGKRNFQMPATLATVLVSYEARPWAYVRYDLDRTGAPQNLKVESSSGLKSFDRAALETVSAWRFVLPAGLTDATGCIAEVAIT